MSFCKLSTAFEAQGVSPAMKLLIIFIADNWNVYDEAAEIEEDWVSEFCCISTASVPGLLGEASWKGFFGDVRQLADGKWRLEFTDTVVLPKTSKKPSLSRKVRVAVRERDEACVYCGHSTAPFHVDHIVPVSRGGTDAMSNLALACPPCNISKKDRLLEEWPGPKGRVITKSVALEIMGAST